jgi:acetyl/propionyl-CoA carboxylase alpha subunit
MVFGAENEGGLKMRFRYHSGENIYNISIDRQGEGYRAVVDGIAYPVEVLDVQPGQVSLLLDGRPVTFYWATEAGKRWISLQGCVYTLEKPSSQTTTRRGEILSEESVRAPMPSQVRSISVQPGDIISKGQTLMILEAMKMEIRVQAPRPGRIKRLLVEEGQTVDRNEKLAEIGEA